MAKRSNPVIRKRPSTGANARQLSPSVQKGGAFEDEVERLLRKAELRSKKLLSYEPKPRITLQNEETVIPDFSLKILKHGTERRFLIECQNRKRPSKGILHKIQHIRTKHSSKSFIFLYPGKIGSALAQSFEKEGITHFSLSRFGHWLNREAIEAKDDLLIAIEESTTNPSKGPNKTESEARTVFYGSTDAEAISLMKESDDSPPSSFASPHDGHRRFFG